MKDYSDSTLNKLWRQAVLKTYNYRCYFCGVHIETTELECHHIIKRKNMVTRWDVINGVPVCKYPNNKTPYKMSCHEYAETPEGRSRILHSPELVEYLQRRVVPFKQWLVDRGMTVKEFKNKMHNELKEIISKNN
jgi:hypothetical protein